MTKDAKARFVLNLKRIDELRDVYDKIKNDKRTGYEKDVLRAAVVSMTAMLEDLIRDVFASKLGESIAAMLRASGPALTEEALKRAVSKGVKELKQGREEDLYEYLIRVHKGFPSWPESLTKLNKRRNDIAHRGDRDVNGNVTPMDPGEVKMWRGEVKRFGLAVLSKM